MRRASRRDRVAAQPLRGSGTANQRGVGPRVVEAAAAAAKGIVVVRDALDVNLRFILSIAMLKPLNWVTDFQQYLNVTPCASRPSMHALSTG